MTRNRERSMFWLALAAAGGVFTLDLLVQLGVAVSVLHVVVVWLAYHTGRPSHVWWAAELATLLTALGLVLSPGGGELWKILLNRGVVLLAIWLTAALCRRALLLAKQHAAEAKEAQHLAAENSRRREAEERRSRALGSVLDDLRIERERLAASEESQRQLNAELERRVEQRTAELADANEALEQSNIELQQFAYVASHDLQTPLRGIAGCAQLLQDDYQGRLDAEADEYITRVVDGCKRLQTMIQDLLTYSRVESRSAPYELHSLGDICDDVIVLLQPSIEDAQATIVHTELPVVVGDRSQLSQLMQNLIGNGIKYRGTHSPRIDISATADNGEWIISVRDNGIGIGDAHRERIFEIFKRLHTQEEYPGSGIGLAICRRIVVRHHGRIWVESEKGCGSVFRFTLPLVAESSEAVAEVARRSLR